MTNQSIYRCLLLMLLCCGYHSIAQERYLKKYTQESGLPGVKSYQMLQDDKHFIWICGNSGVCRFDGRHAKTYTPQNSVCNYGAFRLLLDSSQRLWVISNQSAPVYFQNDSFHRYEGPYKEELKKTYWMLQDSKENLYFFLRFTDIIAKLGKDGRCDTMRIPNTLSLGELINDSIIITAARNKIVRIIDFRKTEYSSLDGYEGTVDRFYRVKDNLVIGAGKNGLVGFNDKDNKVLWVDPSNRFISYCLHVEDDSTYWMGTDDGVYVFRYKNGHLHLVKKTLSHKLISSILKDHNGNYWIASGDDAIYFMNAAKVTCYSLPEGYSNISQIAFAGSQGYAFNLSGNYSKLAEEGATPQGDMLQAGKTVLFFKALSTGGRVLIGYPGGGMQIEEDGRIIRGKPNAIGNYYYRNDSTLFTISDSIVKGAADFHKVVMAYHGSHPGKVAALLKTSVSTDFFHKNFCVDHSNNVWTGRNDSIMCFEALKDGYHVRKIVKEGAFFSSMQCDPDNKIWVATKGAGVLCIKGEKITAVYDVNNGLLNNNCSSLYIDDAGNIWVCFENGLNKLELQQNGSYVVRAYTKNNFLPDAVINCVYKYGNKVYVGTANGLVVFEDDPSFLKDNFPNTCYITDVAIGGRDTGVLGKYELNYGTSISFAFSTVSYNQALPPTYHYKLEGADEQWEIATADRILYEHLNPGEYVFKVYANEWDKYGASISIHINPPFWQKWWFIAVEILLGLGCIGIVCYLFIRSKNRKNELQRRIIENDLKSLRAQINPHFIFNALNSIQDYILDQQPRYANYYLTQFAKLMRMIVDNSRKESVSLADEIHFLKLYLELEKLRLGETFEFEIVTSDEINEEVTFIPPMIIQPIAENSIKHGLSAKKGSKELKVHFGRQGALLLCTITDNGIGREQAGRYNDGHSMKMSTGIENIRERLQLLHAKQDAGGHCILISDLYDDNKSSLGTTVKLLIPIFPLNTDVWNRQ